MSSPSAGKSVQVISSTGKSYPIS